MTKPRRCTALVVDDSPAIRKRLVSVLRSAGLATVEADDGAAAWLYLQGARVDIILTDINMPLVDGLKLIGLVRGSDSLQNTPIVVITSETSMEDRRRARALGADAYLLKPPLEPDVLRVVAELLRRLRA